MKNVKFKSTAAGSYGIAHTDDELVLKNSEAAELEKSGVVEILGDAEEGAEASVAKGSFRINDLTGPVPKEEKTDKFDPTNEAKSKSKEKNDKAGPNAPKKK